MLSMTTATDEATSAIALSHRPLWDDPLTALYATRATHPSKEQCSGARIPSFSWNARDQLTAISGGPVPATFAYDAFGRRAGKTINGTTTNFVYDGDNPVQELAGGNNANLLTGLGVDEYFIRTNPSGTRTFLTDILGSTVALTDPAGALQAQYTYEAFGATSVTGGSNGNPFAYTGREHDGPIGLYFYRHRYYSPTLHRFISEDPLGLEAGDPNFYAYVGNNPVTVVDPLGLRTVFSVAGYNVDVSVSATLLGLTVSHDLQGLGWSNLSPSISLLTLIGASVDVSIAAPPAEDLVASVALGASRHTSLGTNVAVDWSSGMPEARIQGVNVGLGLGIGTIFSGNIPIGPDSLLGRLFRDAMSGDLSFIREKLSRQPNSLAPQLSGRK